MSTSIRAASAWKVAVLGAGGCVGRATAERLLAAGARVVAVRRPGSEAIPGFEPLFADLRVASAADALAASGVTSVVSIAPIFAVSGTLARLGRCAGMHVVACSSMSAVAKMSSLSRADRGMANALLAAEREVLDAVERSVIIRPTMIYGHPATRNVASLQRFARKCGWLAVPTGATGLRQPVHYIDLANVLSGALAKEARERIYEVGGGEALPISELVSRVAAAEGARLIRFPSPAASVLGRFAGLLGFDRVGGVLFRAGQDQTADNGPAIRDFGFAPRPFAPIAKEA